MAQKRNPVSLRLQTRLQGHEKRFASCWFTDFFFSQACANDLLKRLYLGHLLQKGGSWYSEKSESRVPEACISIQFLYRRCSILSIILDKRKEEYVLSNSLRAVRSRREATPTTSRQENATPFSDGRASIGGTSLYLNHENAFLSTGDIAVGQINSPKEPLSVPIRGPASLLQAKPSTRPVGEQSAKLLEVLSTPVEDTLTVMKKGTLLWPYGVFGNKIPYLTIANSFASISCKRAHRIPSPAKPWQANPTELRDPFIKKDKVNSDLVKAVGKTRQLIFLAGFQNKVLSSEQWIDWFRTTSREYDVIPGSAYIAAIESICEISREGETRQNQKNASKIEIVGKDYTSSQRVSSLTKSFVEERSHLQTSGSNMSAPLKPAFHWSSCSFIRGVSSCQSIEFCLYSVIFLYKKRLSFLQIKETFFKMLEASGRVRGARLVCSGRQGGRSKSAMRAKKQSALWGQTALSLFSSRLAFASTGIDTSFGQIGIKIWICYK